MCVKFQDSIGQAQDLNLCQFVVDELHKNFSSGKYKRGCLLYCMVSIFVLSGHSFGNFQFFYW